MSSYEKLKIKYDNIVRKTLNSNKNIMIDSLVDYYGEEYRNIIVKRYNEITFIYYSDPEVIDLVVNEFIPKVPRPEKYADFINFSNAKKKKQSIFAKLFKVNSNLPDNLIGTTNQAIFTNIT